MYNTLNKHKKVTSKEEGNLKENINPIPRDVIQELCKKLERKSQIPTEEYWKFGVKRGLRNSDGTGVMAGLTKICSVEGYFIDDGEKVPKDGVLKFRGIDINDIVDACEKENRFGFEEVVYLLLFGFLPTEKQLKMFKDLLGICRTLPDTFIEDVLMKNPPSNIMNKLQRCVLVLYSYDTAPDDTSPENILRQSIQLIAQMPILLSYTYQIRRKYLGKSMYIHSPKPKLSTSETILRSLRANKKYTDEEAKLLDIVLILHAEHGGGNNSTFICRSLTSSGTDSYSAYSASIGALKGPRHGGANVKVCAMIDDFFEHVEDVTSREQVGEYIRKIIKKEAGDGSGLVYGMGHAVYTMSDPRAVILKKKAKDYAYGHGHEKEFDLINLIEELTPDIFREIKGINKPMCANVDLYSGLVLKVLGIDPEIFTSIFATARIAGWSAHRIEEVINGGKIIRPAYKSIATNKKYVPIAEREEKPLVFDKYLPAEERVIKEFGGKLHED